MLSSGYLKWLFMALTPVVVFALFKFLDSRASAGNIAGIWFLIYAIANGTLFWREGRRYSYTAVVHGLFLVFFVLPILLLRWLYWPIPLNEIQLLDYFRGSVLHRGGTIGYLAVVGVAVWEKVKWQWLTPKSSDL